MRREPFTFDDISGDLCEVWGLLGAVLEDAPDTDYWTTGRNVSIRKISYSLDITFLRHEHTHGDRVVPPGYHFLAEVRDEGVIQVGYALHLDSEQNLVSSYGYESREEPFEVDHRDACRGILGIGGKIVEILGEP